MSAALHYMDADLHSDPKSNTVAQLRWEVSPTKTS